MSQFPTPRGTARAIRRGNAAPSLGFEPLSMREELLRDEPLDVWADKQLYRSYREEGYSREQALLQSGLADPDSL